MKLKNAGGFLLADLEPWSCVHYAQNAITDSHYFDCFCKTTNFYWHFNISKAHQLQSFVIWVIFLAFIIKFFKKLIEFQSIEQSIDI